MSISTSICPEPLEISFETLPFDVQILICEFLNVSDFSKLTRTSKRVYNDLWRSEDLWRRLLHRDISIEPIPDEIRIPPIRDDRFPFTFNYRLSSLGDRRYFTRYRLIISQCNLYLNESSRIPFASINGFENLLKTKLDKNPTIGDINLTFKYAIYYKYPYIIKYLHDKYENRINYNEGLIAAICSDDIGLIVKMLDKGANKMSEGIGVALRPDVFMGRYILPNPDTIMFLTRRYKVDARSFANLIIAVLIENDRLDYIREVTIDPELRSSINRQHCLDKASCHDNVEIIDFICQDTQDGPLRYNDALVNAARYGYLNIVNFTLQRGATHTITALIEAAANGHLEVVKILFQLTGGRGYGNAICACQGKHLEVWKYLRNTHREIKKKNNF